MTQWFFPSWNGDVRIESDSKNADKTIITMIDPTADEKRVLISLADLFREKGWMNGRKTIWNPRGKKDKQSITLNASMLDIGLYMVGYLKPGIATLTAVKLENGKVKAKATGEKGFIPWLNNLFGKGQELGEVADFADMLEGKGRNGSPHRKDPDPAPDKPAKVEKVATVKRPTPSCPACIPGSIEPANEVLQSFLDEEQHEQWAKDRSIIVTGGLTGHRYLLAHRHSKIAQRIGKICYDLDDGGVLHFHDWAVPPEEEVLAAKLCIEHREPWLRNEATCLSCSNEWDFVFKNPFGGFNDGIPDSEFTAEIGSFFRGFIMTYENGKYALPQDRKEAKKARKQVKKLFVC